jgi:hypothetical protein
VPATGRYAVSYQVDVLGSGAATVNGTQTPDAVGADVYTATNSGAPAASGTLDSVALVYNAGQVTLSRQGVLTLTAGQAVTLQLTIEQAPSPIYVLGASITFQRIA